MIYDCVMPFNEPPYYMLINHLKYGVASNSRILTYFSSDVVFYHSEP
jgi:hypothetical protein